MCPELQLCVYRLIPAITKVVCNGNTFVMCESGTTIWETGEGAMCLSGR